jgi:hemerythrin-like domain-containing protein
MAKHAVVDKPDTQEMVVVHRVFRREFRLAPQIVRQVSEGDVARASVVVAHLTEMGTMLHHHHSGEDELVWPRLNERAQVSADLVARMEAQHEQVAGLMHRVDELRAQWAASASATVRDELAAVLTELSSALDAHLDEEEREVLPLIEQHLSCKEWDELGERGRAGIPKPRMLVVLGHILEDTSPEERTTFLGHMPPPARVLYRMLGQRKFDREVAVLRRDIPAQRQR